MGIEVRRGDAASPEQPVDAASPPVEAPTACALGGVESCVGPSQCVGTRRCVSRGGSLAFESCYCRESCQEAAPPIYLISDTNALYTFSPRARLATLVAALSCHIHPVSMAVDRAGGARVLSDEGELYRVNLGDGACTRTSFAPGKGGFFKFGMGYTSDEAGGEDETLYISGDQRLGALDPTRLAITTSTSTALPASELTGTPEGLLFAFVGGSGRLAELDKTTGALRRSWAPKDLKPAQNFAMAAWAGELWLFGDRRAHVFRLEDESLELAIPDLGFQVVGAGVSTCAPHGPALE